MLNSPQINPPMAEPAGSYRVGLVTTYPPTRCGIARFSSSLEESLRRVAPELRLDIVRLMNGPQPSSPSAPVAMEIDPDNPLSARAAARHLNRCDVVVLQHEYGIYGANDGAAVLDIVDMVDQPIVAVLHTVVGEPSTNQRGIIEHLGRRARLVVLSEAARSSLATRYDIPRSQVVVIPHGAHWSAQPARPGNRPELITWGLLGPGKGLERSISAMSLLKDLDPQPRYRIVGRTHPAVAREHGYAYRHHLEGLVRDLGVDGMVEFIDRYVGDDELLGMVSASDIVVVPYDNNEQVSSGVVTEAIAAGRVVVATAFPHAVELLRSGAGSVVDHDSRALADAIRRLVVDRGAYRQAVAAAAELSPALSWQAGATRYANLIRSLVQERAFARSR